MLSLKGLLGRQSLLGTQGDSAGQSTPLCDFRFSWLTMLAVLWIWDFHVLDRGGLQLPVAFAIETETLQGFTGQKQHVYVMVKGGLWGRIEHKTPKQSKAKRSSCSNCLYPSPMSFPHHCMDSLRPQTQQQPKRPVLCCI